MNKEEDNKEYKINHRVEEMLIALVERSIDSWMVTHLIDSATEPFCSKVAKEGKCILYVRIEDRFYKLQLQRLPDEEEWEEDSVREKDFVHMKDHNIAEEAEQVIRNLGT